jgi:agmatine/peptidylarginine deiminase
MGAFEITRWVRFLLLVVLVGATARSVPAQETQTAPLPRWREGGTPFDPAQSLQPYALSVPVVEAPGSAPAAGLIASPEEYGPTHGVLFWYRQGSWHQTVIDCVVALTADPVHDEIAYVVVTSAAQQASATSAFTAGGADMSKVVFIEQPGNSIWLRDYGPHFIWQDGTLAIVDSHYYPSRPEDNFAPTLLADPGRFDTKSHHMGVYYSGGNFQPGPNRSAFMSSLILLDNTTSQGFTQTLLEELYGQYQGIDTLHIMPQLPFSVDGTGHIDMWMYLVDEDTVIISQFKPGSNATAISITNNAVPYMQALGFEVFRTDAWNVGGTHYTYTNAFRVNDRIFVPIYGLGNANYLDEDASALAAWQAAAGPGVEIIPIDCYSIIPAAGAIHCIVMQVPRHVSPLPAACVRSPSGGELVAGGSALTIEWEASDTYNTPLSSVDLYYTLNDGASYTFIATTADTGSFAWTVPLVFSNQARVKVVAHAVDGDQVEAVSADTFEIAPLNRSTYDFSSGGGVHKFGFGSQTGDWNAAVSGVRLPVTTAITSFLETAYLKLSSSNATGGDTDPNRYISPNVSSGQESTHVFEFRITETPSEIDDIGVLWEGYANQCTQAELYVWDYVAGQWGDGTGLLGQNRFMDNGASNRDRDLVGSIRSGFSNYIAPSGEMTFLVYAERTRDETFHDYMRLQVSRRAESTAIAYCTAGTSASGCRAQLTAVGTASATAPSGFDLQAVSVEGSKDGLFFLGTNGRQATPWGSGTSYQCVVPPVRRAGLLAGVGTNGACDGSFSQDLNALWCPTCPKPAKNPGAGGIVQAQLWYRDPLSTSNRSTSLSDALEFLVAP